MATRECERLEEERRTADLSIRRPLPYERNMRLFCCTACVCLWPDSNAGAGGRVAGCEAMRSPAFGGCLTRVYPTASLARDKKICLNSVDFGLFETASVAVLSQTRQSGWDHDCHSGMHESARAAFHAVT